jgi:hypothetical protein
MNGIIASALPVFGLLACLFLGFILLSSESRSGERMAYVFFGVGVVWLIASGSVLWPTVSHAKPAPAAQVVRYDAPAPAGAVTPLAAQPAPHQYGYPTPFARYGFQPQPAYGYAQPHAYRQPNVHGHPVAHPYAYGHGYRQAAFYPYGYYR